MPQNVLKEVYKQIRDQITSSESNLEFTNQNLEPIGQSKLYKGHYEDVIVYPTVLIEFNDITWTTRGKGTQRGNAELRIHLCQESFSDDSSNSQDEDQALAVLDTVETLNGILHDWKPANASSLNRAQTTPNEVVPDNMIVYVTTYQCVVEQTGIGKYRKLISNNASADPDAFDVNATGTLNE